MSILKESLEFSLPTFLLCFPSTNTIMANYNFYLITVTFSFWLQLTWLLKLSWLHSYSVLSSHTQTFWPNWWHSEIYEFQGAWDVVVDTEGFWGFLLHSLPCGSGLRHEFLCFVFLIYSLVSSCYQPPFTVFCCGLHAGFSLLFMCNILDLRQSMKKWNSSEVTCL